MKQILLAIILMLLIPVTAQAADPSFDCEKARSIVEKLICSNDELANLDRGVAAFYKNAIRNESKADKARKRKIQRRWVKTRERCGSSANPIICIRDLYQQRIDELSNTDNPITEITRKTRFLSGAGHMGYYANYYILNSKREKGMVFTANVKSIDNIGQVNHYPVRLDCLRHAPKIKTDTGMTNLDLSIHDKEFIPGSSGLVAYSMWWAVCRNVPNRYEENIPASKGIRRGRKYSIYILKTESVEDFEEVKKITLKYVVSGKKVKRKSAVAYCSGTSTLYIDDKLNELLAMDTPKKNSLGYDVQNIWWAACVGDFQHFQE